MSWVKHLWKSTDYITPKIMNDFEDGIELAVNTADTFKSDGVTFENAGEVFTPNVQIQDADTFGGRLPSYFCTSTRADAMQTDINSRALNSDLTTLDNKVKSKVEFISIAQGNATTNTYSMGYSYNVVFFSPREGFACMIGYWANTITVLVGSLPSGLSITKQTNSNIITITNNIGHSLNGFMIMG